jgi:phosphoglycerate kinase
MVENIRFLASETSKIPQDRQQLANELAKYGEVYVGDGFGAVHREHASVFELASLLPNAAGQLIVAEVEILEKLTKSPDRPYGVILGGAKVSDKIAVISNLLEKVDVIAIGGGMAFTFLAALGNQVGKSLVETDLIPTVKKLIERAEHKNVEMLLPTDILVGREFSDSAVPTLVKSDQIPVDQMGLDIGPESAERFAKAIYKCKTVFWNGPMGVFEFSNYANGTKTVATALAEMKGMSVIGGGDSAAAVRKLGFSDKQFGYISTGGGASLEYLEGKQLPGLVALS